MAQDLSNHSVPDVSAAACCKQGTDSPAVFFTHNEKAAGPSRLGGGRRAGRPVYHGTSNPKDAFGKKKVPLHLVPLAAQIEIALALENGAEKYGAYNWRDEKISANVYLSSCLRHILAWGDGQEKDSSSGLSPLAHALACLSILVDSIHNGCVSDDRFTSKKSVDLLEEQNNRNDDFFPR